MFKVYEFHWQARHRLGQRVKGKMLAANRLEVEQKLLKKGFTPQKIQRNFILPQKPKNEELTRLLSQFALLYNASVPLKQILSMSLESCSNIRLYQWLLCLDKSLASGYSFSQSLTKNAKYLSVQEMQLIQMGEKSGKLGIILQNIVENRQYSEKLAKKVKKILFYPVFILVISLLLSLGLLVFIVPKFADLYADKGQTLPWVTDVLFTLSKFLQNNWIELIVFALFWASVFWLLNKKTTVIKIVKFKVLLVLPVFKHIIRERRIVFFCHNLALMLSSAVHLDNALEVFLSENKDDPILQREIMMIQKMLQQGHSFSQGINSETFGEDTALMLLIAEKNGQLPKMLAYIADMYRQKLDYQIDLLSQLLEPMLMLLMGLIVGTVIVGLYLPIFDMGTMME